MQTHLRRHKAILMGLAALLSTLPVMLSAHTANAAWSRGVRGWWVGVLGAACRDGATVAWVWADPSGQAYGGEKSTFRLWQSDTPGEGAFLGYASMQPNIYTQPVEVTAPDGTVSSHTTYAIRDVYWPTALPVGTSVTVEDPQAGGGIPVEQPAATTSVVTDCSLSQQRTVMTPRAVPHVLGPTELRAQSLALADGDLTYRVTALPAYGALQLNGTALALGDTFTQIDINNGLLTYVPNSDAAGDSFGYSVDGMAWVSLSPDRLYPDFSSAAPKISANGGVIAFASEATNLTTNYDNNFVSDIFKWLANGETLRLTTDYNGNAPDKLSTSPAIAANGGLVAFQSDATNLRLDGDCSITDADLGQHVFSAQEALSFPETAVQLRRRSVSSGPLSTCQQGNGVSYLPAVGSDNAVLFLSSSDNLLLPAADPDGTISDVFSNSPMSVTTMISTRGTMTDAYFGASSVAVGGTGNDELAAFSATDGFVAGDNNGVEDLYARYVRGPRTGQTLHISKPLTATQPDGDSRNPAVSRDGRWVAFASDATNLVEGDTNGRQDIYLRNVISDTLVRVSVGIGGAEPDGDSREPVVSADGRYVAFSSTATNLAADDTSADSDVFVRDMWTGETTLVSKPTTNMPLNASIEPSISDDGHHIAFRSTISSTFLGGISNVDNIFVRYTGYTNTITFMLTRTYMPFVIR